MLVADRFRRQAVAALLDLRYLGDVPVLGLCTVVLLLSVSLGLITPIMPLYLTALGAGAALVGLMFATASIAEGAFAILWGTFADRIGIRAPLLVQTAVGATCLIAFATVQVLVVLFPLRFVLAAAGAAFYPLGRGYLGGVVPERRRGTVTALFFVLLSSGTSIGAIASGVFAETFGFPSVFFVAAAANVAAGVLVIVAVGKQRGSRAPTSDDPIGAPEVIRLPRPPLLVLAAVAVFGAAASQASQIFIPLLMTEHAGIPIDHVGYAYGLTGLVGILLLMLAGGLTDLIGRKFVVVVALSLVAAGDAGLSYARTFMTIVSCMLAAQIGLYMLLPPIVTLLSRISPPRNQLRSQGLFTLVLNVGFTIGALTSGWIWGLEGPTATYLYAAVLALIAWVVAVTLIDETRWLGSARTGPPVSLR